MIKDLRVNGDFCFLATGACMDEKCNTCRSCKKDQEDQTREDSQNFSFHLGFIFLFMTTKIRNIYAENWFHERFGDD